MPPWLGPGGRRVPWRLSLKDGSPSRSSRSTDPPLWVVCLSLISFLLVLFLGGSGSLRFRFVIFFSLGTPVSSCFFLIYSTFSLRYFLLSSFCFLSCCRFHFFSCFLVLISLGVGKRQCRYPQSVFSQLLVNLAWLAKIYACVLITPLLAGPVHSIRCEDRVTIYLYRASTVSLCVGGCICVWECGERTTLRPCSQLLETPIRPYTYPYLHTKREVRSLVTVKMPNLDVSELNIVVSVLGKKVSVSGRRRQKTDANQCLNQAASFSSMASSRS